PGDCRCRECRYFGDVVRRRHLDDIHPGETETGEPAQNRPGLPGREPSHLGRPGSGREGRVERIDVKSEIRGAVAEHRTNALGDRSRPAFMHLLRGDDRDAFADRPVEDVAMQRRADADLNHPTGIDEPLFNRMEEWRAMPPSETKAFRPSIDMPVE